MRSELSPNSYIEHYRWLDDVSATALFTLIRTEVAFEQRSVVMFGRPVAQPRLIAWCGAIPYTYSGLTLTPRPVPSCLTEVVAQVSAAAETPFNHLLLNLYRNGEDSMGYHADDEPELGVDPVVATLSLGTTRRFVVKSRRGAQTTPFELANGDLLIMGGKCQAEFVHAVPKQARISTSRLSITFRRVLPRDERG